MTHRISTARRVAAGKGHVTRIARQVMRFVTIGNGGFLLAALYLHFLRLGW